MCILDIWSATILSYSFDKNTAKNILESIKTKVITKK
jgi:hypothetical protein